MEPDNTAVSPATLVNRGLKEVCIHSEIDSRLQLNRVKKMGAKLGLKWRSLGDKTHQFESISECHEEVYIAK